MPKINQVTSSLSRIINEINEETSKNSSKIEIVAEKTISELGKDIAEASGRAQVNIQSKINSSRVNGLQEQIINNPNCIKIAEKVNPLEEKIIERWPNGALKSIETKVDGVLISSTKKKENGGFLECYIFNPEKNSSEFIRYQEDLNNNNFKEVVRTKNGIVVRTQNYNSEGKVIKSINYNPDTKTETITECWANTEIKKCITTIDGIVTEKDTYLSNGNNIEHYNFDPNTKTEEISKYWRSHQPGENHLKESIRTIKGTVINKTTYNSQGNPLETIHFNPQNNNRQITTYWDDIKNKVKEDTISVNDILISRILHKKSGKFLERYMYDMKSKKALTTKYWPDVDEWQHITEITDGIITKQIKYQKNGLAIENFEFDPLTMTSTKTLYWEDLNAFFLKKRFYEKNIEGISNNQVEFDINGKKIHETINDLSTNTKEKITYYSDGFTHKSSYEKYVNGETIEKNTYKRNGEYKTKETYDPSTKTRCKTTYWEGELNDHQHFYEEFVDGKQTQKVEYDKYGRPLGSKQNNYNHSKTQNTDRPTDKMSKDEFIEEMSLRLSHKNGFLSLNHFEQKELAEILQVDIEHIKNMPKDVYRQLSIKYRTGENADTPTNDTLFKITAGLYKKNNS